MRAISPRSGSALAAVLVCIRTGCPREFSKALRRRRGELRVPAVPAGGRISVALRAHAFVTRERTPRFHPGLAIAPGRPPHLEKDITLTENGPYAWVRNLCI